MTANSLLALFMLIPTATWLSFITATVIPYLSALVTPHKNAWTGIATALLALVSGICSSLALPHSDWKQAVGTAFVTWLVATKWHSKVLSGTHLEGVLHADFGVKSRRGVAHEHEARAA